MKRDARLRGLSSDHHHALVWARRLSLAHTSWGDRLRAALQASLEREIEPHFQLEEQLLAPALRAVGHGALSDRLISEHTLLRRLAQRALQGDLTSACQLGIALRAHVRFEERTLLPLCEQLLPDAVLAAVAAQSR